MESWDRSRTRWASWGRNVARLLIPAAVAAATTLVWLELYKREIYVKDADEILTTAILVIAAIFAIAAALILNSAWERSRALARCILTDDKQGFMVLRDEKLSNVVLIALVCFAVLVVVLLGACEYPNPAAGKLVMATTTFSLTLYFVVLQSAQNPMTSVWFDRRTPQQWKDEDADAYFKPLDFDPGRKK